MAFWQQGVSLAGRSTMGLRKEGVEKNLNIGFRVLCSFTAQVWNLVISDEERRSATNNQLAF